MDLETFEKLPKNLKEDLLAKLEEALPRAQRRKAEKQARVELRKGTKAQKAKVARREAAKP